MQVNIKKIQSKTRRKKMKRTRTTIKLKKNAKEYVTTRGRTKLKEHNKFK